MSDPRRYEAWMSDDPDMVTEVLASSAESAAEAWVDQEWEYLCDDDAVRVTVRDDGGGCSTWIVERCVTTSYHAQPAVPE
jgi:nitrogen fixation/metabolism regulation signal transduction histidine kinase